MAHLRQKTLFCPHNVNPLVGVKRELFDMVILGATTLLSLRHKSTGVRGCSQST